jgi:HlyD family secretion protein
MFYRFSPTLVLRSRWRPHRPRPGERVLVLRGASVFPPGHTTTRLCLDFLAETLAARPCRQLLDVGCGSGALLLAGIAAGARFGLGLDLARTAVAATRDNARANGLAASVAVVRGSTECLRGKFGVQGSSQRYRTARVEQGEINSIVTATGTINPVTTVLVGSQVSGTIKSLYADFNSQVKEGQVIAQIDPALFEAQVEQARANVLNAQGNLLNMQANSRNAQANLEKAEVAVLDTKRTLDRNQELAGRQVIAQATLDTAQANYDTAVAQRGVARAQLESAKSQTESAKAQIEQTKAALKVAETNLRYTTIRSPVNGTVISRNVDVGQTVAASLQAPTLFTIAKDLTLMQVDSNVSEADIGRVLKGQEVDFTVDAYPETIFRGKVSEIRNAPQTIQNVVTYDVVIEVGNKELRLKPGMTANVSILIAQRKGALKLPNAALRFRPDSGELTAVKKSEGAKKEGSALAAN